MAKGIRASKQALVQRFNLSERLAVRIVALQTKRVDVTPAVLEGATRGSEVERLLLLPSILSLAKSLSSDALQSIRTEADVTGADDLVVVEQKGWRTIALSEELMAEDHAAEMQLAQEEQLPVRMNPLQLIDREDAAELFTPSEITNLKVILLTSADPREKISALRKLLLSAMPVLEKGAVLISALRDDDAEVRAEAASGLGRLGLSPGVADAARVLATGSDDERCFAAGELAGLIRNVKEHEIPVLLTVMGASLSGESEMSVRVALIDAAREMAPFAAKRPDCASELVQLLLQQIRSDLGGLGSSIRAALREIAKIDNNAVASLLSDQIMKVPNGKARRFLFSVFGDIGVPAEMAEAIAREIAAEAVRGSASEIELQVMANQLAALKEPAVLELCKQFEDAPASRRPVLVRMIDIACAGKDVSSESKNEAGLLFARILKTANKHLRSALLETLLPTDQQLSDDVREELAEEMLGSLREFKHPRIIEEVESKLSRMGQAAILPLLKWLESGLRIEDRVSAARSLGLLLPQLSKGQAALERQCQRGIETALRLADNTERKYKGELIRAVGKMASSDAVPPSQAEIISRRLKSQLMESDCPYDILDAIGQIALHPHAPLQLQIETTKTFIGLIQGELPELEAPERATGEEAYDVGGEVTAYTEMVPVLLHRLERIYSRTRSDQLRTGIADVLLERWREASEWRLLWGLRNTALLLDALGRIGSDKCTAGPMRVKVLDAIAKRLDFPPAVKAIGDICSGQSRLRSVGSRAADIAKQLLRRLGFRDKMADGEADIVYDALGKIAARERLGDTDAEAGQLRQQIVEALFDGLREGSSGAADGLHFAIESTHLPQDIERDASERLSDFEESHAHKRFSRRGG